jgi:DNA polymerase-3 subunit beta
MKLKVMKEKFITALHVVNGVISGRSTLPILSNVLVKGEKSKLWLTGTDLEVTIRYGVDAEGAKTGATTLPARRLLSIVRELPVEEILLELDDKNTTSISCGQSFFRILGLPEEEFPPLPKFEGAPSYSLNQGALKEMLRKTSYAASTDETRHVLNGNLVSFKGGKMTVVATDGRRLAMVEHEMEIPREREGELILPTKAVNELLDALHDDGPLKILTSKNQVAFQFDDVLLITKLIEGTYPNYKQVVPSESEQRIAVDRESLLTAIRRVALLTSEKSNSVKLTFAKNNLQVSTVTPEVGEARETLPVKYAGKDLTIAFNPEFLMDPLRNVTSDEVFLEFTDELSPGVIKCNVPFVYVLMPVRVT